jgi:hypothetical protein
MICTIHFYLYPIPSPVLAPLAVAVVVTAADRCGAFLLFTPGHQDKHSHQDLGGEVGR